MHTLHLKGGFGEHGRACFLIQRKQDYIMLDCGILDTDSQPYPQISIEVLKQTKYLIVTHCHKDHIGALSYFINQGFHGTLLMTQATYDIAKVTYPKVRFLSAHFQHIELEANLSLTTGKSGHCIGGIWVQVLLQDISYFYTGDYQSETLVYRCDDVKNMEAKFAIVDLGHKGQKCALERKADFEHCVKKAMLKGQVILLPVQKFGRGLEMLVHLLQFIAPTDIFLDDDMCENLQQSLLYPEYLKKEAIDVLSIFQKNKVQMHNAKVIFIGDTHLEQESTQNLVQHLLPKGILISTGRVKEDGFIAPILKSGKGLKKSYIHHQSEEDMQALLEANNFNIVLPFHNTEQEIIIKERDNNETKL